MADKWMNPGGKSIVKHPGALRATAKRAGLITGGEALSQRDLEQLARSKDKKTAARARLAETFKDTHK